MRLCLESLLFAIGFLRMRKPIKSWPRFFFSLARNILARLLDLVQVCLCHFIVSIIIIVEKKMLFLSATDLAAVCNFPSFQLIFNIFHSNNSKFKDLFTFAF